MRTVIVESPLEHGTPREQSNILYARRCLNDCFRRGEAPFASHLLYPGILDDAVPEHRALGIAAGLEVGARLDMSAVYIDRGVTAGMQEGIRAAVARCRPIEFRTFDGTDNRCIADSLDNVGRGWISRTLSWAEASAISPIVAALLAFPADDR